GPPRTVSSKPAGRIRKPGDRAISKHVEAADGLFHRPWQLARPSTAASVRLDRPASRDPGELPRLCRRVLDLDADLARRRAARAHLAQSQARRNGGYRALIR